MTEPAPEPTPPRSDLDLLAGWLTARSEIERLTARFTALAETTGVGVLLVTRETVTFVNGQAHALLGTAGRPLTLATLRSLFTDPGARASVSAAMAEGWRGRPMTLTAVPFVLGDGTARTLSVRLQPLTGELTPTLLITLAESVGSETGRARIAPAQDPLRLFGMYLAALANDLRGPLGASLAHLQALTERADLPADLREAFALYRNVTEDTLTRIARAMEWGRRASRYEATDLRDVVKAAVAAMEMETFPGEIALGLQLEAVGPIAGARDQLQLALEHVLRNACEALAAAGGHIDIDLRTVEGRVALTVRDYGPGIPPSLAPNVFEPFSSTKSVVTGLGLGLAIVKDIVRRHGGEVAIDSGARGTTVTLTFGAAADSAPVPVATRRRRAMIVDDDVNLRELYQMLLVQAGWDAVVAGDSDQALQIAATGRLDAILIDVQMAGRDGVAVVEALAAWHPHLVTRVALHTGYGSEARVQAIAARHGLPIVEKPCPFPVLLATLQDLAETVAPGNPGGAVG